MNRQKLIEVVARKSGYDFDLCKEIIQMLFEIITEELRGYGKVVIQKFGTFYVEQKEERIYRKPDTGEKIVVPARKYPKFRTSDVLKDIVK